MGCDLLAVKLNANRNVTGNLRGFDQFMNIVLDNTVEEVSETERNDMGLVVRARDRGGAFCFVPWLVL
jgi:small nuclear ribonucleoprotein (snRNP)-like protein